MPGKYKGKMNCGSEKKKKLYHNIREFQKITQSGMKKLSSTLSDNSEKACADNCRKERKNSFRRKKSKIKDAACDNVLLATVETEDIPARIDKKIEKFYYRDTGFEKYARELVEDVEIYIETSDTMKSLYVIGYNSNLAMMEELFTILKNDIAEIDPNNEYSGYLDNPIYKLAEEFTDRIKTDRLDQCEESEFEAYTQKLRQYAADLNNRTEEISKNEEV